MTEVDQGFSHFQVIDANPTKGIMNKWLKQKKMKEYYMYKLYYLNFQAS